MRKNSFKSKVRKGQTVFGTWSMTGSATVVEAIAAAGLDFVILDMEHGSMSFETAEHLVRAAEGAGCCPIIRVFEGSEAVILRALETGAGGIMVPHVSTPEQAAAVVSACYYAPQGSRGLSPYTRNHAFTHEGLVASMKAANDRLFVGVLVEGTEGIANLEQIAAVKGLDMVYTGIYDLSQSIGLPGELTHPSVYDIQRKCVAAVQKHGPVAGSFARDEAYLRVLKKNGFRFLAYSADAFVLKQAYARVARTV